VRSSGLNVAVLGHVEWVQFASVGRVPLAGEVAHASDPFEEPCGGGTVAAVQLARLAGRAVLVTAVGDDELGRRALARLGDLGVDVRSAILDAPTRRALTLLDEEGERTITTLGPRLQPHGAVHGHQLAALEGADAVYVTAGDEAAVRAARECSRVLVASPRARGALAAGITLDALVLSGADEIELDDAAGARADAEVVVVTEGAHGGSWTRRTGESGRWEPATPPASRVDVFGCGDSFAAGLTYGLGAGMSLQDALAVAARCGAVCLTGRGPYERQLGAGDL
jgi:ribokinase